MDLGYNTILKINYLWSRDVAGHGTHIAGIVGAVRVKWKEVDVEEII